MDGEFQPLLPDDMAAVLKDERRYEEYVAAAPEDGQRYEEHMEAAQQAGQLCEKYVDALLFIHDLLCEFSATGGRSRFNLQEIEDQIQQLLNIALIDDHHHIKDNITANYKAAQAIRKRGEQSQTVDQAFALEQEATQFLGSLLRTYRTLRTSRGTVTS